MEKICSGKRLWSMGFMLLSACRAPRSQGFLFTSPGLGAGLSPPAGLRAFTLFHLNAHCQVDPSPPCTQKHTLTPCVFTSCPGLAAPPFLKCLCTMACSVWLCAPLTPALPLQPGSCHPGPHPQEQRREVGGHRQAPGEAHLQPHRGGAEAPGTQVRPWHTHMGCPVETVFH